MRTFNTTAVCIPSKHYMVDLTSRLEQIKTMIDAGQYFVVNRARQYGKTTLFAALYRFLKDDIRSSAWIFRRSAVRASRRKECLSPPSAGSCFAAPGIPCLIQYKSV